MMNNMYFLIILLLSLSLIVSFKYHSSSSSINSIKFYRSNSNSNSINKSPNYLYKTNIRSNKLTQHNLFLAPQIAFVASCVAAVVTYVALNIDDIKEKQKIATDKAMVEQTTNIKSAVDSQKAAIEKARLAQEAAVANAKRAAETAAANAKKAADEASRRK